ncbi:unnamed protein product [Adineta ricciae]|uniref:Kelch repeat protein n=1 Tax=Adineta ricciae TaxID=249248 RepID=A0A814MTR1_ADIRI|nr:unnamed protein product [Adineta ricciae]CAF1630913.1 unnamed protein product [Adineta ricciae]
MNLRLIVIGVVVVSVVATTISLLAHFLHLAKRNQSNTTNFSNTTATLSSGTSDNMPTLTGISTNKPITTTQNPIQSFTFRTSSQSPTTTMENSRSSTSQVFGIATTTKADQVTQPTTNILISTGINDTDQGLETDETISSTFSSSSIMRETTTSLPSYWNMDALLMRPRSKFGTVLLLNKLILVTGGYINSTVVTSGTELYNSSSGWTTGPSMKYVRYDHTLTAFANGTRALAAGSRYPLYSQSAEVYDSLRRTWSLLSANMSYPRYSHTAVLLGNEQILIAGGFNASGKSTATAEIFNPSSNTFTNPSTMLSSRAEFTSTILGDKATVLVTGGFDAKSHLISQAELYTGGTWTATATNMNEYRAYHSALLLNDGTVLIAGGGDGVSMSFSSAEIYNVTSNQFTLVGSMKYRRALFTLTLLPSGKALATGGFDWTNETHPTVSELYDPMTKSWSTSHILNYGRMYHKSVLLNDSVLTISGRSIASGYLRSTEKYYF